MRMHVLAFLNGRVTTRPFSHARRAGDVCLPAPRRRARASSLPCQVIHTSTRAALFLTTTRVAVLNKQVSMCLRLQNNRNYFHRVQSWRHTWYVTTGASHAVLRMTPRITRGTRHATATEVAMRVPHVPHIACCTCVAPSQAMCSEVSSLYSSAVSSHAMDPANAFTFNGAVGDARTSFGSVRGERVHANAAQFSSAASPWALPGGGSGACAPPVDLAALVQLTAWIKALGELIRMQDGQDSRFVDVRERAVSVLESWVQQWYDRETIPPPCP